MNKELKINKENKELTHRLNRAIGQIQSIKTSLENGNTKDCLETIRLLKAANNALKSFGEAYVNLHLRECLRNGTNVEDIEQNLKEVINSAFTL